MSPEQRHRNREHRQATAPSHVASLACGFGATGEPAARFYLLNNLASSSQLRDLSLAHLRQGYGGSAEALRRRKSLGRVGFTTYRSTIRKDGNANAESLAATPKAAPKAIVLNHPSHRRRSRPDAGIESRENCAKRGATAIGSDASHDVADVGRVCAPEPTPKINAESSIHQRVPPAARQARPSEIRTRHGTNTRL